MRTFSPWYSGTPSYSTYSDMGSSALGGGRPSIKQVQREQSAPVAMPHNTTTITQAAPQQRQQRPQQNLFNNVKGLADMARKFMDNPGDITGTGPSAPGYSLGMDLSGEEAIMAADRAEILGSTIPAAEAAPVEAFNYVPGAALETNPGFMAYGGPGIAGIAGGKIGGYFGKWMGDKLGVGGEKDRSMVGGVLGGATTGAIVGSGAGGIGAIPGAFIGGIGGALANFF